MKNHELETISDLTGSSKSAVSKALNHCFGVERSSRERILMTARQEGIRFEGRCDFYAIFPDRPVSFWRSVMRQLIPICKDFKGKFNVYPKDSHFVLEDYLNEARRLGARLILISISPTDEQYRLLRECAAELPIVFLFERVDIVNTFCITSDAYLDGAAMRQRLNPAGGARVLILDDGSIHTRERVRGFTEGGTLDVRCLHLDNAEASAAELARAISAMAVSDTDIIYAAAGQLRETALAAVKLGMRGGVVIAGHELRSGAFFEGDFGGVPYVGLGMDAQTICRLTGEAVDSYLRCGQLPGKKYMLVPSFID